MYHKKLINNINSWGNIEYNVPLRVSDNETRTSYSVAHRHIPAIQKYFDCRKCDKGPQPEFVIDRQTIVRNETYRATSEDYANFKLNRLPNTTYEVPGRRLRYMAAVESMLENAAKGQKSPLESTCHSSYRGVSPFPPADRSIPGDVPSSVRKCSTVDEVKVAVGSKGITRLLDPYLSTYLTDYGVSPDAGPPPPTGDTITIYSVKAEKKPGGEPKIQTGIPHKILKEQTDRVIRKKFAWCKGSLLSENRRNYKNPLLSSRLAVQVNTTGGVEWNPNPSPYKKIELL